ncbi:unnamed protein product [Chilo suppressalis]|uniref:Uncharacterized protein n=1 Tax=Chilo suppressalis TaxID=168631 RepID=A0ABN8BHV2_CHISP|nr:unnamed protein product [Chilo suppressalis]
MIGLTCKAAQATPAAKRTAAGPARAAARRRSAQARRHRARSHPAPRPTRTCRTTRRDCAPRRRTCPCTAAPALMAADRRSRRASWARVAAGRARVVARGLVARALSTSAPTAWCSRTTPETWPPSSTSTSPALSPSTNQRRVCPWCLATCRRRSSTRRRRRAWRRRAGRAPESTCTTTTRGTSTTAGTVRRRTGTRRSTTRRTTTWRRGTAWAGCCWAARRCINTSPSTGRTRSTRRTSTPPPARPTTRPCQVWKRRCKTRPRIFTGSERDLSPTNTVKLCPATVCPRPTRMEARPKMPKLRLTKLEALLKAMKPLLTLAEPRRSPTEPQLTPVA